MGGRYLQDERLDDILTDFRHISTEIGKYLLRRWEDDELRVSGQRKKPDGSTSLKTDRGADKKARKFFERLAEEERYQDTTIITEETSQDDRIGVIQTPAIIYVDTLDGTSNFKKGPADKSGYDWAVCFALCERTDDDTYMPTVGLVHIPTTGQFYIAGKGAGARRRDPVAYSIPGGQAFVDVSLRVSSASRLENFRMLVSELHGKDEILEQVLDHPEYGEMPHADEYMRRGSAAVKMCLVASGEAEAYFNLGKRHQRDYDVCASHLILGEAGGMFTCLYGRELHYNRGNLKIPGGIVISNGRDHDRILFEIARRLPQDYLA